MELELNDGWGNTIQPEQLMDDPVMIVRDRPTLDLVGNARAATYKLLNPTPYASFCGREDYLLDRLDFPGLNLYARDGQAKYSGVRLNLLSEVGCNDYCKALLDFDIGQADKNDVVIASRLFVAPGVAAIRLIRKLFTSCYRVALDAGKSTAVVLSRPEHISFYEKYGYRQIDRKAGELSLLQWV